MSVPDIQTAVRAEIKSLPRYAKFTITKVTQAIQGIVLELKGKPIHGAATPTPLTEDFHSAGACWYIPANGTATVSRVDPDNSQVRLINFKNTPPQEGREIFLYPPNYLKALLSRWEDHDLAQKAIAGLHDLLNPTYVKSNTLFANKYAFLRPAQRRALNLLTHSSSFLLGPPGTGKTTTLGVMVAEFMVANPRARVLVVSTTNLAVDQALISVDNALEHVNETGVRFQLRRIGRGYDRRLYALREHLLPQNPVHVTLEDRYVGDEYDTITDSHEQTYIGNARENVRLYARTITSCIAGWSSLRALDEFDLVVFDEASQISLAHTLLVMLLGKARLFAGDPEQLAPIARSKTHSAQRWLTRSAFAVMPTTGLSSCFLNEQSRMAGPICKIDSEIFYGGLLRVADDALADPVWMKSRARPMGNIPAGEHVSIQHIASGATRSRHRNGWFRLESAQRIMDLVLSALKDGHAKESDIVIITPYRLQRAYLLEQLSMLGVPKIKVSTVHSCQGSEAPFVIFDPVCGDDEFLMGQAGRQLINVAISRAQAKLVVMLSAQDLQNPIFCQMVAILKRDSEPVAEVLGTPQLPQA